jgi:hypothetical protein
VPSIGAGLRAPLMEDIDGDRGARREQVTYSARIVRRAENCLEFVEAEGGRNRSFLTR